MMLEVGMTHVMYTVYMYNNPNISKHSLFPSTTTIGQHSVPVFDLAKTGALPCGETGKMGTSG